MSDHQCEVCSFSHCLNCRGDHNDECHLSTPELVPESVPASVPEEVPAAVPEGVPASMSGTVAESMHASMHGAVHDATEPSMPEQQQGGVVSEYANQSGACAKELTNQQKRRIEDNKEEALLKKARRLTGKQAAKAESEQESEAKEVSGSSTTEQSSSSNARPDEVRLAVTSSLNEQQKRRIEEKKEEAIKKRKMRLAGSVVTKQFSPFDEFIDQGVVEDGLGDDHGNEESTGDDHGDEQESNNGSTSGGNFEADARPLSSKAKHVIASQKLKEVKDKASAKWQEHLSSSLRIKQLATMPVVLEESVQDAGPPRFKVHQSHSVLALRSIVFCKLCGYWAAKKSQKLQQPCNRKPAHSDGAQKLRRLMKGLHPDAKVEEWPDGHDARVPSAPVAIEWSSQGD